METSEQDEESIKFTDEKHSNFVLYYLNNLRKEGAMCDVVVLVNGTEFPVHCNILAVSSEFLNGMINNKGMRNSRPYKIRIDGISAETMSNLLNFIYTGRIELNAGNIKRTLRAANYLAMRSVKDVCSQYLEKNLRIDNCFKMRTLAESYNCERLLQNSNKFIFENFVYISHTTGFLHLPSADLVKLLESDEIHVENEEVVYQALMRWMTYDITQRKEMFPELIKVVRLPLMSPYYLVDILEQEELFQSTASCKALLKEAQQYHMVQDRRYQMQSTRTKPRNYEKVNNVMLAVGGNGEASVSTTVFSYEATKDQWTELPHLLRHRGHHGMATTGGQIYVIGGISNNNTLASTIRYDIRKRTWHKCASMKQNRCKISTIGCNGLIYSMGGFDGTTTLSAVESYNPLTDRWTTGCSMPVARRCAVAVSHGTYVYVIGGHSGTGILNTVDTYDTISNEWKPTEVQPMVMRRSFPCAGFVDNALYVFGGYDGWNTLHTCESYDFNTRKWKMLPPMEVARSNAGSSVMGKNIYAVGGWDGVCLSSVEVFNVTTTQWTTVSPLPLPTTGIRCSFLPHQIFSEMELRGNKSKSHSCVLS